MHLITCNACGCEWFEHVTQYRLSDEPAFDGDEAPGVVEHRYEYHCRDCGEVMPEEPAVAVEHARTD